jgi:hypothetical protein
MLSKSDNEEIKASILEFLIKKGRWGAHYFPKDTLIRWIGKKVKRNGKKVKVCLMELVKQGYVLTYKKGETISLNPTKSKEIIDYIEKI